VALVLLSGGALAALPVAQAQLVIDVNRGTVQPLPLAVMDLEGNDPAAVQIGRDIAAVMRANLLSTGLFADIPPASFIERVVPADVQPRFADWRLINARFLITGRVTRRAAPAGGATAERIEVEYRLWDIVAQTQLIGGRIEGGLDSWRRAAHRLSDQTYTRLTGDEGYFDSRIVFVSESGPATARRKRLVIMDQDGANPTAISLGSDTVITPRFSPTRQELTFMMYENNRPQVYLYDIPSGRLERVGEFPGMTFAPRFTPDGDSLLFTVAERGNSDIYIMRTATRQPQRLTTNPAIDTSPSMSPNGQEIVFTSDRGGTTQLYIMRTDGRPRTCPDGRQQDACRITFGGGRYSTPVWSPRGDYIAFTKQEAGQFSIGVIKPDGTGERTLSTSFLEEGPTWSPNGRVVMFYRDGRSGPRLYSVDLTGRNLRQVPTPGASSDPAWSPLLGVRRTPAG
jgi:TolB protein